MEEAWELAVVSGFINHITYLANIMQDLHDAGNSPEMFPMQVFHNALVSVTGEHDDDMVTDGEYEAVDIISNLMLYVRLSEYDVKAAPKLSESEKSIALKKVARAKEFLSSCMAGNNWRSVKKSYLKQDYIDELRMISVAVGAVGTATVFDKNTAKENAERLREVLLSLNECNLPLKLKSFLTSQISALINIFDTFQIFGPRDAEIRVKEIVMEIGLYKDDLTPDSKAALTPLIAFCGNAMGKFKTGVDYVKAGQYVLKMLGVEIESSD